ncbi:MAG TPA: hypothetical protein VHL80_15705, partial [Polyangia bacterium]|nr:hypothetical protein [Polyangia bacterium]
ARPARAAAPERLPRAPRADAPPPAPAAVQRFDFVDDEITGELARPDTDVILSDPATHHPSLIELREHFIPEILESLEDL